MRFLEQIEQRIEIIFANVFRALLVITIMGSVFPRNRINLLTAVLTLVLIYLPFFIADRNQFILTLSRLPVSALCCLMVRKLADGARIPDSTECLNLVRD